MHRNGELPPGLELEVGRMVRDRNSNPATRQQRRTVSSREQPLSSPGTLRALRDALDGAVGITSGLHFYLGDQLEQPILSWLERVQRVCTCLYTCMH
jgi:hypothetical protein